MLKLLMCRSSLIRPGIFLFIDRSIAFSRGDNDLHFYLHFCFPGSTNESCCPSCKERFDSGKKRRLIDTCGHARCYSCMFSREICPLCPPQKGNFLSSACIIIPHSTTPPQIRLRGLRVPSEFEASLRCNNNEPQSILHLGEACNSNSNNNSTVRRRPEAIIRR